MKPAKRPIRILRYLPLTLTAFAVYFVTVGLGNNRDSLFLLPVSETLGVSRTVFSFSSSISHLTAFLISLFFGVFYRKFGYRKFCGCALLLTASAYFLLSRSNSIFMIYLGTAMIGITNIYNAVTGRIITSWYEKKRGLILGLALGSSGLGGAAFEMILSPVLASSGWRIGYLVCAGVVAVLVIPVLLFVRTKPEDAGMLPYGAGDPPPADAAPRDGDRKPKSRSGKARPGYIDREGLPFRRLVRRPSLYFALAGTLLLGWISYGAYPYFVAHLQDQGMDPEFAAHAQSIMFIAMAAAKFLTGTLCDYFKPRNVLFGCVLIGCTGLALIAGTHSPVTAVLGMCIYSVVLGAPAILFSILAMSLFGKNSYDMTLGLIVAMNSLSGVLAGPVTNLFYGASGSYTTVFYLIGLLSVVVIGLFYVAFRLAGKDFALAEREAAQAGPRAGEGVL